MVVVQLGGLSSQAPEDLSAWRTYVNEKYRYEIRYPGRFEVRLTGAQGERDGATISIRSKEYAAPAPVLDVYVGDAATKFDTRLSSPQLKADVEPAEVGGMRGAQTTYRWRENGEIAFLIVRFPGVLFRFDPGAGIGDAQGTIWLQVLSTFRFLPQE